MNLSLRYKGVFVLLAALLPAAMLCAAGFGAYGVAPWRIPQVLMEQAGGYLVLTQIRFPRVLTSMLVGAALGTSGAALQGIFRNPLADPALIGISMGAGLGAAVSIVLIGSTILSVFTTPAAAILSGGACTALVLWIARGPGGVSTTTLLLAGIAINALAGAGIGMLTFLSNEQELRTLTFWLLGGMTAASWKFFWIALAAVTPGLLLLLSTGKSLNALSLGEREAYHLGVSPKALRLRVVLGAALAVGGAVAIAGNIGFIGLVVPHLLRLWAGPDHRFLLPGSALAGAALLCLADLMARTIAAPVEIPVGILTSMLGSPFFLFLILQQKRREPVLA